MVLKYLGCGKALHFCPRLASDTRGKEQAGTVYPREGRGYEADQGCAISKGSVAYLDDASLKEVGVTESQLADAREAVERHISGIITKDFRPQSGQHCRSCDYGSICRWRGC